MKYDCSITLSKSILIFILVAAFLVFEMAVQVSPGVMTQDLMLDLKLDATQLGLMSGCYFFTYTLMQIPAGLLYDRFNVRYVIILPLLICSAGVFLFSLSHDVLSASLARILMGTGSAFAFIGVLVVAADIFPKRYFALLAGLTQMLAAFGAMGGQLPLLWMIHAFGWRHSMMLLTLMGLILAVLIYLFVCYKKCPSVITHEGGSSIIASLSMIVLKGQTWWVALYACFMWAPMAAFASLWGVPYLVKAFMLTAEGAAFGVSLMWLGLALCSPLLGWFSDYLRNRRWLLLLCALISVVTFVMVLMPAWLSPILLNSLLFLLGAACAGQALSFALVRDNNADHQRAAAIGFNNMAVVIAGAIFQPVIGKLISWHAGAAENNSFIYQAQDFHFGLMAVVFGLVLAFGLAVFLIKEPTLGLN